MSLLKLRNLNLDLNLDLNAGNSGQPSGVRFNTHRYGKAIDPTAPLIPPQASYPKYPVNWDAELRSYFYLNEFALANRTWRQDLIDELRNKNIQSPDTLLEAVLSPLVTEMIDAAWEREDRFAEILHQHGAEGAINYWMGMLMLDSGRYPKTHLLIRVARRIGEMVAMVLKDHYKCPRPSQFCLAIVPMIDPPATPSFPAGHALQSHLIAACLVDAMPARRVQTQLITEAAKRIAENRVIAGLHFSLDNRAGEVAAAKVFAMLKTQQLFVDLIAGAKDEIDKA